MSATETKSAMWAARDWGQALLPYRRASAARGVLELTVTFPPFVAVWTAMLLASRHGQFWLSFALAPLAAGLLIRLFLIQHDCGHGSFFPSKLANDWMGRAIGVVTTMTPYDHFMAALPMRDPSRDIGQSRPSRPGRHQDAGRCANTSRATGATVCATASIAIPS